MTEEKDSRAIQRLLDRASRVQWRLIQAVLGRETVPETPAGFEPEPGTVSEAVASARQARAMSTFARALARGEERDRAHVSTVRALCDVGLSAAARSFVSGAEPLVDDAVSAIGRGVVLHTLHEYELGWRELAGLPSDLLTRLVPVEAVTCALSTGTPESVAAARSVAGDPPSLDSPSLVELAGRFLVTGHADLARRLADEATRRDDLPEKESVALAALHRWTHHRPTSVPWPGQVSLGVMDYHQPDHHRASNNVGDYVQTLAMLGNLARFGDARFEGEEGIGELMRDLQARVRPGLGLRGGADVHLTSVSRDFSTGDAIPEGTWLVAFGWHLHSTFRLGFGLPYHPHLNPIFVSFHLNRVRALSPATVAQLRERGPVGCRDWTTVDLLLSAGVDAFFTGCLTTTVDAVFPPREQGPRDGKRLVGAVDLNPAALRKIKADKEVVTHAGTEFREASLVAGTRAAVSLLEHYRQRFSRVVTTRLHAYLPATSLGIPTRFRPPVPGDVRFDGLLELTPGSLEFEEIRDGIRELLAEVHGWILAGLPEEEVYTRWRERTAGAVAEARARLARPAAADPALPDLTSLLADAREAAHRLGPHETLDESTVTDVAVTVDATRSAPLLTAIESVLANARGAVRLWVTTRGVGSEFGDAVARTFPELPMTFFRLDHVALDPDADDVTADADRLLLPELLDQLDRVIYLDADTVTEGDIGELARIDLQGHAFAARTARRSGAQLWRDAGDRLAPAPASELRRIMSARHAFDFEAVDAGVLVLDLARLRRDRFVARFVPLVQTYRLDAREVLNAYAGGDRAELAERWDVNPLLAQLDDAGVVRFGGAGAPWDDDLVPGRELWWRYAARVAERQRQTVSPTA